MPQENLETARRILLGMGVHAKGKASGIEGDISYFTLLTFRGNRIVRMENVMHESDALVALG